MRKLLVVLLVVASACAGKNDVGVGANERQALTPAFPSTADASDAPTEGDDAQPTGASTPEQGGQPTTAPSTPSAASPPEPGSTHGVITDATGDVTPTPLETAPKFADLVGARLIRRADGFELRVRLADTAPSKSPDDDHTMNIASFYELDGDREIDFQVWLNLGPNGWGGSWFDNGTEQAKFQDEAQLTFSVEGDEVIVKFPVGHVGGAEKFRWSLASEYGRYEAIGTVAMARDDAPDNDQPAAFPN